MKKISVIIVAAMLLSAGSLFANNVDNVNPSKDLSAQIGQLLEKNQLIVDENSEAFASVLFTLNDDKEIVVISVYTDDEKLESFVKSRLNYQKVTVSGNDFREGKMFRVPVRIKA